MTDRRLRPPALAQAKGRPAAVAAEAAFLHAAPAGARDRQLVLGETVTILAEAGDWAFVEAAKDGYCGHIPAAVLAPPAPVTHVVSTPQTHLYPAPDLKQEPRLRLFFGAGVEVTGLSGRWADVRTVAGPGVVHRAHLRDSSEPASDPVAVAAQFLGAPYLWAGNTVLGLDCSGLVQAAMRACGVPCPGDSDQQARMLGEPVPETEPLRPGDAVFWTGHVALVSAPGRILHATAYKMAVIEEALAEAADRIAAQGDGPVTCRRRPALSPDFL